MGELEWGHAVSKDLIHWEELPRPLNYQEDNGAMFSGCGVVDDENTSGLFGDEKDLEKVDLSQSIHRTMN